MKRAIAVAAVAGLVISSPIAVKTAVDQKLSSASQMHERLFVHYLLGSGEDVSETFFTHEEIQAVKDKCMEDVVARFIHALKQNGAGSSVAGVEVQVNTYDEYGSPLNYSLGRFSCLSDGARDVYDFRYAPKDVGKPIKTWGFYFDALDCAFGDTPRCLVRKGYGKPFDINIKF